MADNTTLNTMAGGDVIATDDIAGVKHQRVKVGHGSDGAYADASAATPLPVAVLSAPAVTGAVTVSGTHPVTVTSGSTLGSAKATVAAAGTRVQLATNAGILSCTVRAKASNVGLVYVGGSTVTAANGFDLAAGEAISLDVTNTNVIWVDASTSGDGVSYLWVVA